MAITFRSILRQGLNALVDAALSPSKGSSSRSSSRPGTSSRSKRTGRSTSNRSRPGALTRKSSRRNEGPTGTREVDMATALAQASYEPSMDGDADPGEVVWTWVPYEDDPNLGKDRPVVVIGRKGTGVYVVQLTSKDHDVDAEQEARWGRYWLDIGTGPWDTKRRPSEVRLDRALWVPTRAVRREGAVLPRATWEKILTALREHA